MHTTKDGVLAEPILMCWRVWYCTGMCPDVPRLKVPCPFITCRTFHVGLDELETHLRESESCELFTPFPYGTVFVTCLPYNAAGVVIVARPCEQHSFLLATLTCPCLINLPLPVGHSRKKQCVCGRAFISESSLIQHFKDVLVLDLKNPMSQNMFSCTPSRG